MILSGLEIESNDVDETITIKYLTCQYGASAYLADTVSC